jgi:hypothetical protein
MEQENGYDMRYYHWYAPWAFLHGRVGFDYGPAQLQSYLNPLSFVPFYLLAGHTPASIAAWIMGAWHGLTFGLVFAVSWEVLRADGRLARAWLSLLCAAVGTAGPVFLGELGTSHNDVIVSQLVLVAVLLLLRGWRASASGARLMPAIWVSGLVLGAAVGLKLVVGVHAVAALVALVALPMTWRRRGRIAVTYGVALAAGYLATAGFWMAILWRRFESPLFPFFNAVFRSPYYPETNFADRRFLPQGLGEALLHPLRLCLGTHREAQQGFRDARYALAAVLGLAALARLGAGAARRGAGRFAPAVPAIVAGERFVLVFFVVSYVLWQAQFAILRYAAPLEALTPLIVLLLVRRLTSRRSVQSLLVAAFSLTTVVWMRPFISDRMPRGERWIEVRAPRFENPERVLVVVAHNAPWAFVLTDLQPEIRVLGLVSNLTKPTDRTKFQAEMRDILARHDGDIYLLTDEGYVEGDLRTVRDHFALVPTGGPWRDIEQRHQAIRLGLCPMQQVGG